MRRALRSTTRAGIYEHLRETGEQQTVRDIAEAFDLHPNVARTHLETLADAGLVVVGSRKHPGGGRPAKVYLARSEAGADEIHIDASAAPAGMPATLLRLLGEVIVNGNGAPGGRLEAVRQAAMKEGGRLGERNDETSGSLPEAAGAVSRVLRTEGYLVRIHRATDERVLLSRVGGVLEPLSAVRGGLTSALEWGLLSGAFARIWRPVQLAPVADTDAGTAGWAVHAASAGTTGSRLLVTVAGRVDARNAPRETGVVRAMRAITALGAGAVLEVLTGGPGSPAAFARWADRAGHELIGVERAADEHGRPAIRLLIRKGRT
jgi:predicted ArsR family transcriptional regulator/TusA-related sulfurtransferase